MTGAQQSTNGEASVGRLKSIKDNISAINDKISGALKHTNSNSGDITMNTSKTPKTPRKGQFKTTSKP